jgi:hypothetical protein
LLFGAFLGWIGATAGVHPLKPFARVFFWGVLAMAFTAGMGHFIGTSV